MVTAEVALTGEVRSAGVARRFLVDALEKWGAPEFEETAALVVGELVANAALHARTEIVLRLSLNARRLRVEVVDRSPRQPVPRHYSAQATTGRGLSLVEALSERWGVEPTDGGKTVWAVVVPGSATPNRVPVEVDLSAFPDLELSAPGDERMDGTSDGGSARVGRSAQVRAAA